MSNTRGRRLAALIALPALALGATLALDVAPAAAAAQTRYVAPTGDDGNNPANACTDQSSPCKTIQHAVDEADSGDTVSIAAGTYAESVFIDHAVRISGAGQGKTVVTGDSEDPTFEILPQDATISVGLTRLTAAHNSTAPGVVALAATVTVTDDEVSDNAGGGVVGLISSITVSHSVISDNTGAGDAFFDISPGTGLGDIAGSATVDHSTVSGNAGSGVAVATDLPGLTRALAADDPQGDVTVRRSTVSGNAVGGVVNFGADATVDVSTVSGNIGGGVVGLSGLTAVTDSTITGTKKFLGDGGPVQGGLISVDEQATPTSANRLVPSARRPATAGRALLTRLAAHPTAARQQARRLRPAAAPAATSSLTVSGSIVAGQKSLPDCYGSVSDSGSNLSSDAPNSCKFSAAKDDQTKTDPKLGALADNGGATETQRPLKGSPAIDAVASGHAGCSAAATDQRGIARPQPEGGKCDTGAVELAAKAIVISPSSLPHGTVGKAYTKAITATGGQYPTYTWSLASGDLPDGLHFSSHGVLSGTPTKAGSFTFVVSVNDPVTRRYTLVIDPAPSSSSAQPNGSGSRLADTGAPTSRLTATGGLAVLAGLVLLVGAGAVGRRRGRHRAG